LLDIAIAARHWVPVRAVQDLPQAWRGIEPRRRFEEAVGRSAPDPLATPDSTSPPHSPPHVATPSPVIM